MGMLKEFKEFAVKGNLIDIAVGMVMGAAFGRVVSGFVDGIVMPLIGFISGGQDFSKWDIWLRDPAAEVKDSAGAVLTAADPGVALKAGTLISITLDFVLVAFAVFMVIKAINKLKKAEPAPAPAGPSNEEKLLMEIRDALKK